MHRVVIRHRQDGAVIITAALTLLFLLGFMGIALDFGHLFIVKTELQTITDSCALAAAQELDGGSDQLSRATTAGKTVADLNKANFQQGSANLSRANVTFSETLNGTYISETGILTNAKYAKCTHSQQGMTPWLLQTMGAFSGNDKYKESQNVTALAVATRSPAQTSCAIPIAISPKGAGPDHGYTPGEWIPSLYDENSSGGAAATAPDPGHFGWANLNGTSSADDTKNQLLGNGLCDLRVDDTSTPGKQFSAAVYWNSRFGLYRGGGPDISIGTPDRTGYAYTQKNWPPIPPATLSKNALPDFLAKRADYRSYGNTTDTVNAGNLITGLNISNAYKDADMATHANGNNALAKRGGDRRLVLAPFVSSGKIIDFACILMLHPIDKVKTTVYVEYVGNASASSSPCSSVGIPGGTAGPLVPTLVR